jgi:copper(I)-binding protein
MRFRFIQLFAAISAFIIGLSGQAHASQTGDLKIEQPFARATVPGQTNGAAYLSISNKGTQRDRLIAVSTPAAGGAEIHKMSMDGDVMRMREVGAIDIDAGATIAMQPGDGYHIMLVELRAPLKNGDRIALTLEFEKAGKFEIVAPVGDGKSAAHRHHH